MVLRRRLFMVWSFLFLPIGAAMADSHLEGAAARFAPRAVCEITPAPGTDSNYLVFYLFGFNDVDNTSIYVSAYNPALKIRLDRQGQVTNERTPCISDFVLLPN